MHTSILRHKHVTKQTISLTVFRIALASIMIASSLMPTSLALAFDHSLLEEAPQKLLAFVQETTQPSITTKDVFMEETGDYKRTHAVIAVASPVTVYGERAVKVQPKPVQAPVRIVPTLDNPVILEGEASFYSWDGCLGCNPLRIMANGQQLDDSALTMAIGADRKHLVGYNARITNLATGQSAVVRITDTGGFYQARYGNRVADLTIAAKEAIGMRGGLGQVRVEVF